MSKPILFLREGSRNYQRDHDFAKKVYQGVVPKQAADDLEISWDLARQIQSALRERAEQWAGRPVSDAMILRLMFDFDRAKADFEKSLHTCEKPGANACAVGNT